MTPGPPAPLAPYNPCSVMNIASSTPAKVMTVLLSGMAAGLAALLLYQSQTLGALPGCGGGSDCDVVLSSRWSVWFGVPVSLMAMGVYTAMLAAVVARDPKIKRPQHAATTAMALCAIAAIAAALWFVSVQLSVIHALCKYCLATHAAGVAASVLCLMVALPSLTVRALVSASGGALVLVGVLIAGQVLGEAPDAAAPLVQYVPVPLTEPVLPDVLPPAPKDPLLTGPIYGPPTTPVKPDTASPATADPTASRVVKFYGGRLELDAAEVPRVGNVDAKTLMVILYDYTCSHCRATRQMLERTTQKHGDSLAILCLPTPLDSKCNRMIKPTKAMHRYACDLAKISLAFWKVAPDKWVEFDRMLYTNEEILTPVRAKLAAGKLISEKDLTRTLNDPWVDQQVARDVSMYITAARAAGNSSLPMLITERGIMNGTPRHALDVDDLIRGKSTRR